MKLLTSGLSALVLTFAVAPATPVAATPSLEVEMRVLTSVGTMTATGPAVDAGLMCPSAAGELLSLVIGWREPEYNIGAVKRFTCDDGSGTFTVRLQARLIEEQGYPFRWVILDGTGDYAGLRGAGDGWVEDPYDIIPNHVDHHTGRVHIEPAR